MKKTGTRGGKSGRLTRKSDLADSLFAFAKQRKEPLTDARHVRNALARFDQVTGVSDADRARAFEIIKRAAAHYGIDLSETNWRDLGVHPQRGRKKAARKAAATRKRTGVAKKAARKPATTRKRTGAAKKSTRKAATARKKRSR